MEDELPNILPPKGMSTERKWYLYKKIRPFCRYECKDVTCPLPDAPRLTGSSRQSTPGVDDPPDLAIEIEVPHSPRQSLEPPATQRKCGEEHICNAKTYKLWIPFFKTKVRGLMIKMCGRRIPK
uniref:Uncharacterized protein n=1 Tax=Amphimedon queenslandica TaxID=400682 RepID=A0A1X7VWC5_AMPQE